MISIVIHDLQADARYYFEISKPMHLDQSLIKYFFLAKSSENCFKNKLQYTKTMLDEAKLNEFQRKIPFLKK